MLILPSSPDPDYTQTVVMDNISYDMRLQFNPREIAWYMYLGLAGQPYAIKTKVVNGTDLLTPFKHLDAIPKGNLIVIDSVARFGRIGRNDFQQDNRFVLAYVGENEDITA